MATAENRKRTRRSKQDDSLWGSLLLDSDSSSSPTSPHSPQAEYGDSYPPAEDAPRHRLREFWHRFSFWSLIATLLFLFFTGGLVWLVLRMWTPQDMRDIAGYTDRGAARDLLVALRNANGGELIITEGELNRYLRDTCRLRQNGLFSILVHAQGVAVRIHDGYAELIIDRVLSTHFHQTTAINLTFALNVEHGRPKLHTEFRGGSPILGSLPCGGRIGRVGMPQRFIQVLHPALDTLRDCYADAIDIIESVGYRPVFHGAGEGREAYIRLIPYAPPADF